MNREQIVEKLTAIFRKVFSDSSLKLDDSMSFNDVDEWNSLTNMIMIAEIEKEFGIKFKLKDLNAMKDAGAIVDTISRLLGKLTH